MGKCDVEVARFLVYANLSLRIELPVSLWKEEVEHEGVCAAPLASFADLLPWEPNPPQPHSLLQSHSRPPRTSLVFLFGTARQPY
jgi:hypothetical protein